MLRFTTARCLQLLLGNLFLLAYLQAFGGRLVGGSHGAVACNVFFGLFTVMFVNSYLKRSKQCNIDKGYKLFFMDRPGIELALR